MNLDNNKLKERLKIARLKNNMTLEDVANKLGVTKTSVLRWERGEVNKIKLPIVEKLAEVLCVNIAWLAGYDVPMEKTDYSKEPILYEELLSEEDKNTIKDFKKLAENDKKIIKNLVDSLLEKSKGDNLK